MGVDEAKAWIDLLKDGGPYAVLFFLGLAYLGKERYIQQLHNKIIDMSVANVNALNSMRTAMDGVIRLIGSEQRADAVEDGNDAANKERKT